MDDRGVIARGRFLLLAPLRLPAGAIAAAAGSPVPVAPCGLPPAQGCRRLWRLRWRRGAWWAGMGLAAVTVAASPMAGLPGPAAVAACAYAVVLSLPVWMAGRWLARRG